MMSMSIIEISSFFLHKKTDFFSLNYIQSILIATGSFLSVRHAAELTAELPDFGEISSEQQDKLNGIWATNIETKEQAVNWGLILLHMSADW